MNIFGFTIFRTPTPVEPAPIFKSMQAARQSMEDGLGHLRDVLTHAESGIQQAMSDTQTHRTLLADAESRIDSFRKLGLHIAGIGANVEAAMNPQPGTTVVQEVREISDAVAETAEAVQDAENVVQLQVKEEAHD